MKFFAFNLMPYPYLPDDFEDTNVSAWVTPSNELYDPVKGHDMYEEYLEQLISAEELGFDGICVNEHHQTAYGQMPSPNVMASALIQHTKRVKIGIMGNAIPLRDHPLRVAEEVAMLDVMSKGRVISGFVRGIGPEYHTFQMNPNESRERFFEAHDLIKKAWSQDGPFEWYGKHFKLNYVNPWPRPYQQPHPPIWTPSQGSSETVAWSAQNHYTFLQTFSPVENVVRTMNMFRKEADAAGYEASPEQLGWSVAIYVADSDEQALKEAGPHIEYLFNVLLKRPLPVFFPPGYLTEKSYAGVIKGYGSIGVDKVTVEELSRNRQIILGSPETVRKQLKEHLEQTGCGLLVPLFQFGRLPHNLAMRNIELFAKEVMPAFKD